MSETKAQHPERRAEQRWRSEAMIGGKPYVVEGTLLRYEDFGQQLGSGWYIVAATVNGKPREDGGYVFYDKNWHEPNRPMTLISDVPAAAPLAADACKAPEWCDFDDAPDSKDPRIQVYVKAKDGNYGVRRGHRIYCSGTCAPPLAAQPAEADGPGIVERLRVFQSSKPAPQPAPACAHGCSDVQVNTACPTHGKPVTAKPMQLPPQRTDCADCGGPHAAAACPGRPAVPSCMRPGFGYVECDGIVNGGLCESHAMLSRMSVGKPARVEGLRRLGHIAGMHDDDLIGGAR